MRHMSKDGEYDKTGKDACATVCKGEQDTISEMEERSNDLQEEDNE
jgi:hypothetical protein